MTTDEIKEIILSAFPDELVSADLNSSPHTIEISKDKILAVCDLLHQHPKTYFDSLSCLTAIDNGIEVDTMEIHYTLYSIPYHLQITLKVVLKRSDPTVTSVSPIWRAAEWHEREAYDLMGINFDNHPDLRRILLPSDWEGYPLRKDYKTPDFYNDMKVKY